MRGAEVGEGDSRPENPNVRTPTSAERFDQDFGIGCEIGNVVEVARYNVATLVLSEPRAYVLNSPCKLKPAVARQGHFGDRDQSASVAHIVHRRHEPGIDELPDELAVPSFL